jgi:hypothetical protein
MSAPRFEWSFFLTQHFEYVHILEQVCTQSNHHTTPAMHRVRTWNLCPIIRLQQQRCLFVATPGNIVEGCPIDQASRLWKRLFKGCKACLQATTP